MIFEICAIVATLVFIVLGIFIVQTLKTVQFSLKNAVESINNLEIELATLKVNADQLMVNSNETIEKINEKIDDISPFVHMFSNLGEVGTKAIRKYEKGKRRSFVEEDEYDDEYEEDDEDQESHWQGTVAGLVELANLGIKLFKKNKKRK